MLENVRDVIANGSGIQGKAVCLLLASGGDENSVFPQMLDRERERLRPTDFAWSYSLRMGL